MFILEIESEIGENEVSPSDLFSDDDGRIVSKTGIARLNRTDKTALQLGLIACRKLTSLDKVREEIGFVIYVTQSPENFLPNHASIIQHELGITGNSMCFDVNQGCSGFVQALYILNSLLSTSGDRYGLIVCSDTYSHHMSHDDRSTQALFSDGATAVIVEKKQKEGWELTGISNHTDGSGASLLMKSVMNDDKMRMNGPEIFQWTRRFLGRQIGALLDKHDLCLDDVDSFFLHQASKLVLDNVTGSLSIPKHKVPTTLGITGNLVSSSLPFLIKNNYSQFNDSRLLVLAGFGVGLSSSICILKKC